MTPLLARHLGFVGSLRAAGLPVSVSEDLDALAAIDRCGMADRALLREAYAATTVKRQILRPTFDEIFDLWWPDRIGAGGAPDSPDQPDRADRVDAPGEGGEAAALQDLREELLAALLGDSNSAAQPGESGEPGEPGQSGEPGEPGPHRLASLAAQAVDRFGRLPGREPGSQSYSAYTALRRVAPDELTDRLIAGLGGPLSTDPAAAATEAQRRIEQFRSMVTADALRRLAEQKGPEEAARSTVRPALESLDFLHATRADTERMRAEIAPLARRLATRMTRQRRHRRGALDFRRTIRSSLATGGVPIHTRHRPKRPHRTDLVVLCDVSGSVAHFARFTLHLVFALRAQFASARAFVFVDTVHEVTDRFRPDQDPAEAMAGLVAATEHASRFGRTSYGRAFTDFATRHPDAVGPRTSLLVLGDARSNYSDLALPVAADLTERARHAYWLNPEHRRQWDTGDSAARAYAGLWEMRECRNLVQLARFVEELAG